MKELNIPSLYIKGFKSIEEVNLESVSQINLIAGDNNVGKSTILEAIYTYAHNGAPEALMQMAFHRMNVIGVRDNSDYESKTGEIFLQYFNGWKFKTGKSIDIKVSDNRSLNMRLGYVHQEQIMINDAIIPQRLFRCDENADEDADAQKGISIQTNNDVTFFSFDRIRRTSNGIEAAMPVQFIHTYLTQKDLNSRLWDSIALTGLEKYVVDALRIIEPEIENLAFIEEPYLDIAGRRHNRVPYIILKNKSGRVPLSIMGDGMNRILSVILGLVCSKDGICLIDEIENGIYYKRQPELWDMICLMVRELDIQLFATTHSLDCIRNFSASATDNAQFIRLEKRKTGIKAVCYNPDELKVALDNDIELR